MGRQYKKSKDVPTKVLCDRLRELVESVVSSDVELRRSEFTMRVPAERDRDADLVLSEVARRLESSPRWVSVDERLPETEDEYVFLLPHKYAPRRLHSVWFIPGLVGVKQFTHWLENLEPPGDGDG